MTIRALLVGHGKTGKLIEALSLEQGVEITTCVTSSTPFLPSPEKHDVIIDFSSEKGLKTRVEESLKKGIPLVIGTTGWDEEKKEIQELVKKYNGAIIASANFSIGVTLFKRIVKEALHLLSYENIYDVALIEKHHRQKKDHPSGTAKELQELVLANFPLKKRALFHLENGAIDQEAFTVSSVRVGHIPGEHELVFDSPDDTISLTHTARSRNGFARGALVASRWIIEKKGYFTFDDMLDEVL